MVENRAGGDTNSYPAGRIVAVKPCDFCNSAPASLFCRKDTAFFCTACDAKLHGQTKHDRVRMCEVCEQAPACVTCKVDAAVLCVTCDRDIHSANPLARRHNRIPVVPFYNSAEPVVKSTGGNIVDPVFGCGVAREDNDSREIPRNVTKSVDLLSAFNFGFGIATDESQFHDSVNDGVVPVQSTEPTRNSSPAPIADHKSNRNRFEIDFNKRNFQSHSHIVSSSSMENSLLPVNGGGMYCNRRAKKFSATDREARVLRYREKRKKRKFEKKIRYASRKAYAEMRPRIKGRFAKRTESMTVLDGDRWWFTTESNAKSYDAAGEYGVVP